LAENVYVKANVLKGTAVVDADSFHIGDIAAGASAPVSYDFITDESAFGSQSEVFVFIWFEPVAAGAAVRTGNFAIKAASCDCTFHCDMDLGGGIDPLDVTYIVNYVYKSLDARPDLPNCPGDNGDWNCDGSVDPLDVAFYVQWVYKSQGNLPCDPCNCIPVYPDDCPAYP
jgi:hypothetical protein